MAQPLEILELLLPDWHLPPALEFDYLPGGYANDNYRFSFDGNGYVLRTPGGSRPYVDWKRERAFYLANHTGRQAQTRRPGCGQRSPGHRMGVWSSSGR